MKQEYRPELRYFIRSNLLILALTVALFYAFLFFFDKKEMLPIYTIMSVYIFILGYLIYQYIYTQRILWIMTEEQLIYIRGIIAIEKDYLELYRIYDFSEDSSILDRMFGLKNIRIASSDRSTPVLSITGIDKNINLLSSLRSQVELMKKTHKIHEIANYD